MATKDPTLDYISNTNSSLIIRPTAVRKRRRGKKVWKCRKSYYYCYLCKNYAKSVKNLTKIFIFLTSFKKVSIFSNRNRFLNIFFFKKRETSTFSLTNMRKICVKRSIFDKKKCTHYTFVLFFTFFLWKFFFFYL